MNHHQPNEPEDLIAAAINAAEDIRSPLDGRVEQTATDPGAPFASDVLARLAALKKDDRAAFELRRSRLKKGDCRVTALDEAIAKENGDVGGRGPTQADILIGLAASAELFHTRVLPVAGDGSKRPGVSNWKPFQTTRPAAEPTGRPKTGGSTSTSEPPLPSSRARFPATRRRRSRSPAVWRKD